MNFIKRFGKADDGGAMVELAIVASLLIPILFGVVDLGRMYYEGIEVANAAHAGAEYGSLYPSDTTGITAAATQSAPDLTTLVIGTPTWGCECSDGSLYSASCAVTPACPASVGTNVVHRVKVTASARFNWILPLPGVSSSSITLSNTATVRGN